MIVRMRTVGQAARVAELTGGAHLSGKPRSDGTMKLSPLVDVGPDFEPHRLAVESVSVLFELYSGSADGVAGGAGPRRPIPTGWSVTAAKFEVQWPAENERRRLICSHFGARRKAFNWGLAQVKADLDAKTVDSAHESVDWDLGSLRKAWNRAKDQVAPWWADNSKEAYSSGLADLVQALSNWRSSRSGDCTRRRVGFPRFKSARRDPGRVRFTTGAMRLEADRRTIVLPRIGPLRSMESTRRVQRHVAAGRAHILSMTLSEQWGRLFVSIGYAVRAPITPSTVAYPSVRAGVDLGVRTLATVATIDAATGEQTMTEYRNPAPLKATLSARRRAGRELSRRIPGSRGWHHAKAKLARLDRRCVHLRREAAHQLTTELAGAFGQIVIEDLDVAAMKQGMGRRAYRRAVADAAIGCVRPQLAYKATRYGAILTVADRWFASSQIHHGCTNPDGTPCRLIGKGRIDKQLLCPQTGHSVDRDHNAARNLRDWPDTPVDAQSGRRPRSSVVPAAVPETAAQAIGASDGLRSLRKTILHGKAASSEATTGVATATKELRKESA
jgi:putative transposase